MIGLAAALGEFLDLGVLGGDLTAQEVDDSALLCGAKCEPSERAPVILFLAISRQGV